MQKEDLPDLRIWSSQKIRAAQTASQLRDLAAHVEYWKVLDEIDAVSRARSGKMYWHLPGHL